MRVGIVALSGYNPRAIVAFCRYAFACNIRYHLIARDYSDPILLSDYASSVFTIRQSAELELEYFTDILSCIKDEYGYDRLLILPSTEALNRFLLENREILESHGAIIPLVAQQLYIAISDKHSFGSMCKRNGLLVPEEYDQAPSCFPFVAKPRRYCSGKKTQLKPCLILNEDDLNEFTESWDEGDFFYQEFVSGRSYYILLYLPKKGNAIRYSQENIAQQSNGGSIVCAISSDIHKESIADQYIEMLKAVGFFGLVMIEVRQKGNQYYMIEANPRMWGPMQLVVDAQVPIFSAFLRDQGVQVRNPDEQQADVYYFWSGGIVRDQMLGHALAYHSSSAGQLMLAYSNLIRQDVYLRSDTIRIYWNEIHAQS